MSAAAPAPGVGGWPQDVADVGHYNDNQLRVNAVMCDVATVAGN